jgi:hypothetical protein
MNREHLPALLDLVKKLHACRAAKDAACDASEADVSARIKREIGRGHTPEQSSAIAYSELGEPK